MAGAVAIATLLLAVAALGMWHGEGGGDSSSAALAVGTALEPRPTPPLELIDEHGTRTALSAFRGRWVVLAPSMTLCKEVCPITTAAFTALRTRLRQAGLGSRVAVVEVTVDPWRDTPARLRAYRRLVGANFTLLTGTQEEIRRFWKFFGVFYEREPEGNPPDIDWFTHKPETFDVSHTDGLFILDPAGRERMADDGTANVGGHLSPALSRLLDAEGHEHLAHPQLSWSPGQLFEDLRQLIGGKVTVTAHYVRRISPGSSG
ncbi:MAG: SCO family protein [Solirubrobacteraceae bacterium]